MNRITNWSLNFEDQIARRMWPQETRGGFYLDVLQLADEAAVAGDQPHSIAAILLYQQLVEEMLHLIDYWCYFELAIGVHPTIYTYRSPERIMFGQLVEKIRHNQDFPGKTLLLQNAQKLNSDCRIPAAHKLLHRGTLPQMEIIGLECKELFRHILESYEDVRSHFYARFDILAEKSSIPPYQEPPESSNP
jgi:hypothetical protein